MKFLLAICMCAAVSVSGQTLPAVHFNHLFVYVDSSDIAAINHSDFIKNEFGSYSVRTTSADSDTWTGHYLYGLDNYLELFSAANKDELGFTGLAFSVDSVGEINQLNTLLQKQYKTTVSVRQRRIDEKMIPWFTSLEIDDTAFFNQSYLFFWIMEYKPEYFAYHHWQYKADKLTSEAYLKQFDTSRKNKILKRFTGATLKTSAHEKDFFTVFLAHCGYKKIDENSFASPDNFIIKFIERSDAENICLTALYFESNTARNDTILISENIRIIFNNKTGSILFK